MYQFWAEPGDKGLNPQHMFLSSHMITRSGPCPKESCPGYRRDRDDIPQEVAG